MGDRGKLPGAGWGRRSLLRTGMAAGAGIVAAPWVRRVSAADAPVVVNSIRSLTNPYHATWNKGGAAFAKAVGAEYVTLVTEGNSEKGVADIKAMLAKTGGNMVLNVDPNDSPDARPIVEACQRPPVPMSSPSGTSPTTCTPGTTTPTTSPTSPSTAAERQGHGRGAVQVHGRRRRHRGAGRHPLQHAGHRAQAGPGRGAGRQPEDQAARLPGRQLGVDRGAREDQRLAHPVRRRDQGHLGRQ